MVWVTRRVYHRGDRLHSTGCGHCASQPVLCVSATAFITNHSVLQSAPALPSPAPPSPDLCSITVLECSEAIEDVKYLRSDFRVECRGATYSALAAAAALSLVGVGLGFPLLIIIRLRGITAATLSKRKHSAFSFLFLGYRVPGDELAPQDPAVESPATAPSSTATGGHDAVASRRAVIAVLARRERTEQAKGALTEQAKGALTEQAKGALTAADLRFPPAPTSAEMTARAVPDELTVNPVAAVPSHAAGINLAGINLTTESPLETRVVAKPSGRTQAARPDLTRSSFVHIVPGAAASTMPSRFRHSIMHLSRRTRATSRPASACCAACSRKRSSPLTRAAVQNDAPADSQPSSVRAPRKCGCRCQHPVDAVAGCDSGNRAYWEATSLLRRALIVLLARLVPAALPQIAAFVVILTLFLTAHMLARPYRDPHFAFSEGASLLCVILTAALAIIAQPSVGQDGGGTAATVLMLLINAATLGLLLRDWLIRCGPKHVATARDAAAFARQHWRTCCACAFVCSSANRHGGAAMASGSARRKGHVSSATPFAPWTRSKGALSATPPAPLAATADHTMLPASLPPDIAQRGPESPSEAGSGEWGGANPFHGRSNRSFSAAVSLQLAVNAAAPSAAALASTPQARNLAHVHTPHVKPSAATAFASSRRVAVQPRATGARHGPTGSR